VNQFDYDQIPEHMMASLKRYVDQKVEPGGFLSAVLCNDLKGAVGQADFINIEIIPVYVSWLYNEAPAICWGSPEKFSSWLNESPTDSTDA